MLSAQHVDFKFWQYMKEAALHLWKHQVIYLLPLFIFTVMVIAMEAFIPLQTVNSLLQIFFAGFTIFFFMELTVSSTQEKYNPKKYLTSMIAAWLSFVAYIRANMLSFYIIFAMSMGMSLALDIGIIGSSVVASVNPEKEAVENFVKIVLTKNVTSELLFTIILAIPMYSVVDFFVLSRIVGVGEIPSLQTLISGCSKNNKSWRKIFFIASGVIIFKSFLLIFAPLFLLLMLMAITLYSMDVYEIDKSKKAKQEEKQKVSNVNAVPSFT